MLPILRSLFRRAVPAAAACASGPTPAEALYQSGNSHRKMGRLREALASYDQAIELDGGFAQAYCNRGVVQQDLGLTAAALASYEQAIALNPGDAMAHYNRALLLQNDCRWEEALAGYDRAVAADPLFADAQYNRALALLYCGDFEQGWRAYEWRWKNARRLNIGEDRHFQQPLWLGDGPIAGKRLLLHAEGGVGDTLQFCRYATLCAQLGATVLLEVQASLRDLLSGLAGVQTVLATGSPLPAFDFHCPLMSLPLALRTTLDRIPSAPRYLSADPVLVARWRSRLGARTGPRVGLAWSGNPQNTIDAHRSIRLADWAGHLPQAFQYFRLQRDVRPADRATLERSPCIAPLNDELLDFSETAALCECLDLVISVDTSIAHLGAALGRPTWILLPSTADWRWMRERADSPWYPTAKLYRQESPGAWEPVFERVSADLRQLGRT